MENKKVIVTTTINAPTEALKLYAQKPDWDLIVVGDTKTPHDAYREINCLYLPPLEQEKLFPDLSHALGWKTITRRNIGLLLGWNLGYEIIGNYPGSESKNNN